MASGNKRLTQMKVSNGDGTVNVVDIVTSEQMNEDISKHIEEFDEYTNKKIPVDIIVKFYLGAVFNVGIEFLNNNHKYIKNEMIEYIKLLIPGNLFKKNN